jgi:diguanylate cyclase (GGDEF)-like protein
LVEYLDALVELTHPHELQGLATALLETLRARVDAAQVRLLAISSTNRDTEFNESNIQNAMVRDLLDAERVELRLIAEDPDLLFCVRTQNRVSKDVANGRRLVLPIFGMQYVSALLVIDGLRNSVGEDDLLAKLLQVYSNQAFLLARSELDPLTGLYNRQYFGERIRKVALYSRSGDRRAGGTAGPCSSCLALVDIDYFKQVNDRYGHLYGDEMLLLFARLMARSFRHGDMLFRYGGDEFALVLVNVNVANAERVLERFRGAVEVYDFPQVGRKTVSVGSAAIDADGTLDTVVLRADKALYYAKTHGRNQVGCYEKLVAEGTLEPVAVTTGDVELF